MEVPVNRTIHNNSLTQQTMPPTAPPKATYAKVTQKEQCPTRNQAIVLDSIEGLTIRDYALAIGGIIGPSNMISISRISQNRICIYMISEEKADELVNSHKQVTINNHLLEIRPLNVKTQRILISNVHSSIPNESIEAILLKLQVTPKSIITRLKTGLHDAGYTHLLSHRRKVYVDPVDVNKIPQSAQLVHDNISYWIYFSSEKLSCFLCKEEGHLAKHCRSTATQNAASESHQSHNNPDELDSISTGNSDQTTSLNNSNKIQENTSQQDLNLTKNTFTTLEIKNRKRPPLNPSLSVTISSDDAPSLQEEQYEASPSNLCKSPTENQTFKQPKKKLKINTPYTTEEIMKQLEPVIAHYNEKKVSPPMNFQKLANFLQQTYGVSDIEGVLKTCNLSSEPVIIILKEAYAHVRCSKLNKRITRILGKIVTSSTYAKQTESSSEE